MDFIKKTYWALFFILIGIIFLIFGITNDQTPLFKLGAGVFIIAGSIAMMSTLDVLNKSLRMGALALLVIVSLGLTWLDYKAIKDPMDFQKERDYRYGFVIQKLKDIGEVQTSYKNVYNKYCADIDSLLYFVKYDSLPVIRSTGIVPDTLTLAQALERGIVKMDTTFAPASESIFNDKYLSERKGPLKIDSLIFVPFTTEKFALEAGFIERGKVRVPVFLCSDSKPYDKRKVLMVGSMDDPTTSGNWGE